MGIWGFIFRLSKKASINGIKTEIDRLQKDISSYEAQLRTKINESKNVKNSFVKRKLRRRFGRRIKRLVDVLEIQKIVGSEMGKRLGNSYARKIVKLREI